VIAD
jgi:hypothetical protein